MSRSLVRPTPEQQQDAAALLDAHGVIHAARRRRTSPTLIALIAAGALVTEQARARYEIARTAKDGEGGHAA